MIFEEYDVPVVIMTS